MVSKVSYVDFSLQYNKQREKILESLDQTLSSGQYILGEEVKKFEKSFAKLCQTKHAIGVANGTDALVLSLRAFGIGPGDEVITTPNSWISSASCIALVGAKPVFVDVRDDQNMDPLHLEKAITSNTKAIIPVHLTGKIADMEAILEIANQNKLVVIEDAAQAVGAKYKGEMAGSIGKIGCFSLHPLKNLNGAGDAGVIVTSDSKLAKKLQLLRNHGLKSRNEILFWGYNSRLDSLQASILNCRLPDLSKVIEQRRKFASIYRNKLKHVVSCPEDAVGCYDTFHLFVIQTPKRDSLKSFLEKKGIQTSIHYPVPIHLQPCAEYLGYQPGSFINVERQSKRILSLPIHNGLSNSDVERVAESILYFFKHLDP